MRGAAPPGTARFDVVDFSRNPHRPVFARFGSLSACYGKAMAGGPPRWRQRADRIWLAIEVIEQFRPLYGRCEHPVMWRGERGGQGSSPYISERFAHYRDDLGLPPELTSHGLRHSYIRHLIEGGF